MFNYLNCFNYPMKKILTGFLGLFLVIGIVAGAGYALFSTKVTVTGMVLGTATPALEISLNGGDWASGTVPFDAVTFAPLLPGEYDWGEFYLRNTSIATTDPLDLDLTGRLTVAGGDWGTLKDAIQMQICIYNGAAANNCGATATPLMTLAQWNAEARNFPDNPLLETEVTHYAIVFFIDSSYTSTIAGKTITGISFEIVGTQVL